jgi:hypothetical protein
MTVPCKVSTAEMREAFRLNLTPSFWWKAALGNFRVLLYLGVLVAVIVSRGRSIQWHQVAPLLGLIVVFFGLYLFRLHRTIEKNATRLNDCNTLNIDGQGITADAISGARTFTPWSEVIRWREGKLVFTIGDAKTFRTVSKTSLGEIQSGELRSLLLSQIR